MNNSERLISLDVFRGLTIALMIIVNNPGSWDTVYPPLLHSSWHGCTPTDLVFPFFMFIVGAAMWYSNRKYDQKFSADFLKRIFKRSALIYLIGIAITAYSGLTLDLSRIRLMGVLPRIALAYLTASFIVGGLKVKGVKIVTALILLAYWAVLVIFGGDDPFSLEGNFARTFDIAVLGINHIPDFHGVKFDQTGLLSTFPSIANILLGYLAGRMIDLSNMKIKAVEKLIIYGIAGIVISKGWDYVFPINKPLWTSSFVLYSCGFASLLLGILLWLIDEKKIRNWSVPFQVFGINPLFLYVLSELLAITFGFGIIATMSGEKISITGWVYSAIFLPLAGTYGGSLLFALVFTFICWIAGWALYKRSVFIKI